MLVINLPGSKTIFTLNISSNLNVKQLIEEEIFKVFYPYVYYLDDLNSPNHVINIHVSNGIITMSVGEKTIVRGNYANSFDAYRKVIQCIRNNIYIDENYCYLHGSVISINNNTCVFLAETGTGKSSLSVYFDSQEDAFCISDDLVILNKNTYEIIPISKFAHIRKNGRMLFSNSLYGYNFNEFISRYEYPLSEKRFTTNSILKYIFVLNRDVSYKTPTICRAENSQSLLLDNMYLPFEIKNNVLSSIQISQQYVLYNIYYNELDIVYKKIKQFINSST